MVKAEMVHDTTARQEARELRKKAHKLARECKALDGIEDAVTLAGEKVSKEARLSELARKLQEKARLEDLTVRMEPLVKQTKKGEKVYFRWVASWREGGLCKKVYVGSCKKMSRGEALQKARKMKAEALGIGI